MIYINLRKGDVLSKWNENQLVSLLYGVEKENLEIIADRLKKKYQEQIKNTNITLNIRFKSI
jgi:GGDEF domain-containing protein